MRCSRCATGVRASACATDVAARGIDLPNLDLVIHADLPIEPDTLLHRSGRTGRAGRKGVCVLIVPVRRYRRGDPACWALPMRRRRARSAPTAADIEARYREQILEAATSAAVPEEAEAAFVAELLTRVTPEQLAAAYLRQQLSTRPAPEDISPVPMPLAKARCRRCRARQGPSPGRAPRHDGFGLVRPSRSGATSAPIRAGSCR